MKFSLITVLFTAFLVGCTSLHKNPSNEEMAVVYGNISTYKEYKDFFKNHRKETDYGERVEEPILLVASIDGVEVDEYTIPAMVTVGAHEVRFRLHDTMELADFMFTIDAQADAAYVAKYTQTIIESEAGDDHKIEVVMWLEDNSTGEILTEKSKKIMIPFSELVDPAISVF